MASATAALNMSDSSSITEPAWIVEHRLTWARKPALRWYYQHEQFKRIDAEVARGPVVEIGAGAGFLGRNLSNRVITTDITVAAGLDVCADVHALPFADSSIGSIVAVDVLHHFAQPRRALSEIARVLEDGGRLILIEPWAGLVSSWILKLFHHEACCAVADPWDNAMASAKDPMDGNTWLSKAILADRSMELPFQVPGLSVARIEPFGILSYLGSGGFQSWSLPTWFCRIAARLESRLPVFMRSAFALRVLFVLEKGAVRAPAPRWS
jgi:SAM-dependent methyltransferase